MPGKTSGSILAKTQPDRIAPRIERAVEEGERAAVVAFLGANELRQRFRVLDLRWRAAHLLPLPFTQPFQAIFGAATFVQVRSES